LDEANLAVKTGIPPIDNGAARHLYIGSGLSFILRILGTGAMFVALLLLARALPANEFGLYIYIIDLISLISPVVSLGMGQICVRVVSDAVAHRNPTELRWFALVAIACTILIASLMWLAFGLAKHAGLLPAGLGGALLPVSVGLLIALSALRLSQEMFRGARYIGLSQLLEQIIWPLLLIGVALCVIAKQFIPSTLWIVGFQAVFMLASALLLFAMFELKVLRRMPPTKSTIFAGQFKKWIAIGLPVAMAVLLSVVQYRGDVIILGAYASPSNIGAYAVSARLAGLAIFALGAVAAASEPLMRQFFVAKDTNNLQHVVDRAAGISAMLSIPVAALLIIFPKFFLHLFNPEFGSASSILAILATGQLVNALTGPIAPLIIALGFQRFNLIMMASVALVMAVSLVLVIPVFGGVGAAIVTAASATVLNCGLCWYIYHTAGIKTYLRPSGIRAIILDIKISLNQSRS
jgi:O-antigen/teichoic acid export membrane protein